MKKKLVAIALSAVTLFGMSGARSFGGGATTATADVTNVSASSLYETNFDGIKTETDASTGEVYKQHFVNANWLIGMNGILSTYSEARPNGYVNFLSSNERSFFVPLRTFEDFICRFRIKGILADSTPNGAGVGISFNLSNFYQSPELKNNFSFIKSDSGSAVRITGGQMDKSDVGQFWFQFNEEDAVDVWGKNSKWIDVAVVKVGDMARVYFAEEGNTEALKKCRAVLTGVDGNGYMTIGGNLGANFSLDEVSIQGLEGEYENGLSKSYYSGQTKNGKDKVMLSGGSSATLSNSSSEGAAFYKLKVAKGSLLSLQACGESIYINSKGEVRSESGNLTLVSGGNIDFDLLKLGCELRVTVVDSIVDVSVNDGNNYETVAVFEAKGTLKGGNVGVKTAIDTIVVVEGMELKSLERKKTIETRNYDPILDRPLVHEKELSFYEYYGIKEEK